MKKIWTKEEIAYNILEGNVVWVERGVLAIYSKQTETEKSTESTHNLNRVGFSAFDAKILTSFANWLLKRKGNHLSPKQLIIARKKMVKYSGQLAKIANGEV